MKDVSGGSRAAGCLQLQLESLPKRVVLPLHILHMQPHTQYAHNHTRRKDFFSVFRCKSSVKHKLAFFFYIYILIHIHYPDEFTVPQKYLPDYV